MLIPSTKQQYGIVSTSNGKIEKPVDKGLSQHVVLTNELHSISDTAPVCSHSKHDVEIGSSTRLLKLVLAFHSVSAHLVAIECAHQTKTGTFP